VASIISLCNILTDRGDVKGKKHATHTSSSNLHVIPSTSLDSLSPQRPIAPGSCHAFHAAGLLDP
jgi:hypothetical protein